MERIEEKTKQWLESLDSDPYIIERNSSIIISAPHAVEQTRNNQVKFAETLTADLANFLSENHGISAIIKTKNNNDDANFNEPHIYKNSLINLCNKFETKFVLDIHMASPYRLFDIEIGTNNFKNVKVIHIEKVNKIFNIIRENNYNLFVDDFFKASKSYNISRTVSANSPTTTALQIEINSKHFNDNISYNRLKIVFDNIINIIKE